jgi:pimeloyl-ACP methyl ester carboxylesterase
LTNDHTERVAVEPDWCGTVNPADPPFALITSTDGVRVAVHDLGGPKDPTTTVLLFSHATGLHGRVWEPMASHLTDRFRCLALDYRGHGVSETPDQASLAWPRMGDDASAVLESDLIGPHQVVHGIGHSMGGAALVLAEARRPGRLRSLWLYEPVIVPPGALSPPGAPNPMADAAERRRATFDSLDDAVSNFASKPPLNELHPAALRAYVMGGFASQPDGTVRLHCRPSTEAAVFRGAAASGAWEVFSTLDLPVAIVAGRLEPLGPVTFVPAMVQASRGAALVERRQLGHFGPMEDPHALAGDVASWIGMHS